MRNLLKLVGLLPICLAQSLVFKLVIIIFALELLKNKHFIVVVTECFFVPSIPTIPRHRVSVSTIPRLASVWVRRTMDGHIIYLQLSAEAQSHEFTSGR